MRVAGRGPFGLIPAAQGPDGILVIVNWRDRRHPDAGGAEVVCEELAKGFAQRGENVVLLTAASPPNPAVEQRDGYTIRRRGGRLGVYPAALWWMARHRRTIAAVIDSQNGIPFFTPAVLPRRTPVVLLLHHVHQDQFLTYFTPLGARLARFLESAVTRWVYGDRVIATVSPSTRSEARVRLGLKGEGRVIPPGAPDRHHRPSPDPRAARPRIVCVGRLVAHKRVSMIVGAMSDVARELPGAELHLIGEGPDRRPIEELVARLGLQDSVVVHGALPSDQRDSLMLTAWLTVSASQREGWGLSILEANAFGVPAVAFRRPGLKDSIRDGETGWLVDQESGLTSAIIQALRELGEPNFARAMRLQTQSWAEQFSWDAMTERFAVTIRNEAHRLALSTIERRVLTDLACVAEVPRALLPDGWKPQLRLSDEVAYSPDHITFLFHGADTETARPALSRVGLGPRLAEHGDIRIRVARPTDLLALRVPSGDADGLPDVDSGDGLNVTESAL